MTIAAELDRIISAKSDILSAINDKGVSTAGTTSISQCPALINAIQTGGGWGSNKLINSGITGSAVVSGSGAFRFSQIPISSYDTISLPVESGFISSYAASRTAYKSATVVFDSAIRHIDTLSASGIPNFNGGSAFMIISVRTSDNSNVYSASLYRSAIGSNNSARFTASASTSVVTSINSALSANDNRKLYLLTGISASGTKSAALNTGYTASTANIYANAAILTSTSLPYPDEPASASGIVCSTATAYEQVYEVLTASATSNNVLFPEEQIASSYYGSGRMTWKWSGDNGSITKSSQPYFQFPLGFSLFNTRSVVNDCITNTASARQLYSSIYPTAAYKYSSLILPPPMTSIVSQNII